MAAMISQLDRVRQLLSKSRTNMDHLRGRITGGSVRSSALERPVFF